jgi:hypothetical protein
MTKNNVKQELQYWKKLCEIYRSAAFANRELLDDVTTGVDYFQCIVCGVTSLVDHTPKNSCESVDLDVTTHENSCEECGGMICYDCSEIPNEMWIDKPHKCEECSKFILCLCEDICASCREKKEKEEDKDQKQEKDKYQNQKQDKEEDQKEDKEEDKEEEPAAKKKKKEDVN